MKFLKSKYVLHGTDAEYAKAQSDYNEYKKSCYPSMSSDIKKVADDVNFHDGVILWAQNNEPDDAVIIQNNEHTITVEYILPKSMGAAQKCTITYEGVIPEAALYTSLKYAIIDRRTEILASEIIQINEKFWCHNLLIHPEAEVSILFENMRVEMTEQEWPTYKSFSHPFSIRFD